jgi:putative ABC transport system substrate-binding protein
MSITIRPGPARSPRRKFLIALGAGALARPFAAFAQQQGKVWRVRADDKHRSMRRSLLGVLAATALAAPSVSFAQSRPPKLPRIGFLQHFNEPLRYEAFMRGLRELGYVDGKTIIVDYQPAAGNNDRLAAIAAEFVQQNVDVIVADGGTPATLAAKKATQTIPIVFPTNGDPVATGVVANLAHPGGNVTGLSLQSPDTTGKVLELLKEIVTRAKRVAFMVNPANTSLRPILPQVEIAAKSLGVEIQLVEVKRPADFAGAFGQITRKRADALVIWNDTMLMQHSSSLAIWAAKYNMPSMRYHSTLPEHGGLASYGPSRADMLRRAAIYVD